MMIATSNLIKTPKVVTINQNRWSRSVKFTGHDLLEWVVTVDQNTQSSFVKAISHLTISKGVANATYFTNCIKVLLVIHANIHISLAAELVSFAVLPVEFQLIENVYLSEQETATKSTTLVVLEDG